MLCILAPKWKIITVLEGIIKRESVKGKLWHFYTTLFWALAMGLPLSWELLTYDLDLPSQWDYKVSTAVPFVQTRKQGLWEISWASQFKGSTARFKLGSQHGSLWPVISTSFPENLPHRTVGMNWQGRKPWVLSSSDWNKFMERRHKRDFKKKKNGFQFLEYQHAWWSSLCAVLC